MNCLVGKYLWTCQSKDMYYYEAVFESVAYGEVYIYLFLYQLNFAAISFVYLQ